MSNTSRNVLNEVKVRPVVIKIEDDDMGVKKEQMDDDSVSILPRKIAKFFYGAGVNLNALHLSFFKEMLDFGLGHRIPTYEEFNGNIVELELKNVKERVEELKQSWVKTGCSILLDCWTDQTGKLLISFLVYCPKGTVFLKSVNATKAVWDVNEGFTMLERVLRLVGVNNVVQIIANDPSFYLEMVGKKLVGLKGKYKSIVWAKCVDYCIDLIFERIARLENVRLVLEQAKTITTFIHSHALPYELMKKYIFKQELVHISFLKWVSVFITLENMMLEKENFSRMFSSSTWKNSCLASKSETIVNLVESSSFWASVADIVMVSSPLVKFLNQMNRNNSASLGFLYDYMDRAKEEIRNNFGGEEAEALYMPYWEIIDDIWNNYLHNDLHPTAAFFNPRIYYSGQFVQDSEVVDGVTNCISVIDEALRESIISRLDAYEYGFGSFGDASAKDQISKVPPAYWWSIHGIDFPEMQKFAFKILSQTCSTAARYKLKRNITEWLHAGGRSCYDQQKLVDLEFVQNNLRLWHIDYSMDISHNFGPDEVNPMKDWLAE